jgi:hypothetical protein
MTSRHHEDSFPLGSDIGTEDIGVGAYEGLCPCQGMHLQRSSILVC